MSDPIEILERRLKQIIEENEDSTGLHFFCQIGGNYNDLGIITLQISGAGSVLMSWRQDEDNDVLVSVKLAAQDLRKIHLLLYKFPFWTMNLQRRPRKGDETNIHLRVSDRNAGTHNGLQFWSGDMHHAAVLDELMKRVGRLILLLSDDEISSDDLALFHLFVD